MNIHIHPYITKKLFSTFEKIARESAMIDNQRAESLNKKGIKLPRDLAARTRPTK